MEKGQPPLTVKLPQKSSTHRTSRSQLCLSGCNLQWSPPCTGGKRSIHGHTSRLNCTLPAVHASQCGPVAPIAVPFWATGTNGGEAC